MYQRGIAVQCAHLLHQLSLVARRLDHDAGARGQITPLADLAEDAAARATLDGGRNPARFLAIDLYALLPHNARQNRFAEMFELAQMNFIRRLAQNVAHRRRQFEHLEATVPISHRHANFKFAFPGRALVVLVLPLLEVYLAYNSLQPLAPQVTQYL